MYENKYILFDENGNVLVTFNSNIKPIIKDNLIIYLITYSDDINLFGLYDTSGYQLLDFEYSKIDIISSKYFITEKYEEQLLCSINMDDVYLNYINYINYINITRKEEENEKFMKRLSKFIRRK